MVVRSAAHAAVMLALTAGLAGCAGNPSLDRGVALYRTGHYTDARDVFDTFLSRYPDSAAAYVDRGVARIRLGDVSGALADYTRALALAPLDPDIYYNCGNAYVLLGKPAEAIADYSRAIELRPTDAAPYFNRGAVRARNDVAGARADWTYAVAIEGDPVTRTAMLLSVPSEASLMAGGRVTVPETTSASPPTLSSMDSPPTLPGRAESPGVVVSAIDARALATRGIVREIDGDCEGARTDLEAAFALETDAARRAALERLLRFLDAPR
jgi:tetratricopeptide (TPR) repeat protein